MVVFQLDRNGMYTVAERLFSPPSYQKRVSLARPITGWSTWLKTVSETIQEPNKKEWVISTLTVHLDHTPHTSSVD